MERVVLFWIAAGVAWMFSAWFIVAAIVEVARGKNRPLSADIVIAVFFHGALAVAALKLASFASG